MTKKAGFVAIIGKPNTGKSTLLNSIIGSKLSIVTPKAQTTRKRVLGIFTEDATQMIFIDTPGILKPMHKLHESMLGYIEQSVNESDVILLLLDMKNLGDIDSYFTVHQLAAIKNSGKPVIALLNKTDLIGDKKQMLPLIHQLSQMDFIKEVIPISALKNQGIKEVLEIIAKFLPENEFYYDPELLSIQSERFFVSEIIRENVYNIFQKEIPYSTEIFIAEFKEREFNKWYISAEIIIERQSQKGIIIGAGGKKIKELGEKSRIEIEAHLEKEIYLELFVKVRENWRKKPVFLKSFGY